MRGLVVPERTEDFTADPVELFFDLTFVFAFSQLVGHLIHHPTWTGGGEALLIFLVLWLPWSQFTWSANAVSGNSRTSRSVFLIATIVSVPMAASVSTAFEGGGPLVGIGAAAILLLGLALMVSGLETGSIEYRSAIEYSIPNLVFAGLMIVGGFLDGDARVVVWIIALVTVVFAAVRSGSGTWIVRSGHFAERHGLIIIIALGEVIVAIGVAVVDALEEDGALSAPTALSLVAAGVFATLLWWSYFDRPLPALEHRAEGLPASERGPFARDVYTFGHIPIVAGIILAAAALEEITLHPDEPLHGEFRLMLVAGIGGFLGGVAIAAFRAFRAIAKERIAAFVAIGAVLAFGADLDGLLLIVIIDCIIAVALLVEHRRVEGSAS